MKPLAFLHDMYDSFPFQKNTIVLSVLPDQLRVAEYSKLKSLLKRRMPTWIDNSKNVWEDKLK
ncbi:hypothetical protein SK3146_01564 [Paenibacillus konkukensis]|uniref:Uncharacterized protein n=1 Tax=Paenibacillus konkukensis TaxID=2020716 RepID=A0ABY4RJ09_9BACL|nr:hypothetical protein SK3146_01564 [Paenibacillus konkukensis]